MGVVLVEVASYLGGDIALDVCYRRNKAGVQTVIQWDESEQAWIILEVREAQ